MNRTLTHALIAAAMLLTAAVALGNGRPPAAFQVHDGPEGSDTLLVGASFGLLFTTDGGESWRWACEQAMQPQPFSDPVIVWRRDGTLLQGTGNLLVSSDGGCSWTRHAAFVDRGVVSLAADPHDDRRLFLGTGQSSGMQGVWRSLDGGAQWTQTSLAREATFFSGIAIAPADPARVYASAFDLAARAILYRSNDGGDSWQALEQVMPEPGAYRVLGVAPDDPATVFAVFVGRPRNRVQRSVDGGASFETVLEVDEDVRQLAFGTDGAVYVATSGALYRARADEREFSRLAQPHDDACVAAFGDALYACADPNGDPFAVGVSRDGGETFSPLVSFERIVGPLECPSGSQTATVCEPLWAAERRVVAETWGVELPPEPERAADESCSCTTVRAASTLRCATLLAGLLLLVALRARPRRSRRDA